VDTELESFKTVDLRAYAVSQGYGCIDSALAMLAAFASVGATAFDLTVLDLEGRERGFQSHLSLAVLRSGLARRLEAATRAQSSLVIRPRSATVMLIQLDDCDEAKARRLAPYAFLTVRTSPGNWQVWLAVSDAPTEKEAAKQFRTRVQRGVGADRSATGATRIAGSLNFKTKYAAGGFPVVALGPVHPGRTITTDVLAQAGLIADPLAPKPPASVPKEVPRQATSKWPDYQQALNGAPKKTDGTPDRSRADFMWCKWAAERGWTVEATAAKLAEVSIKAQERRRAGDRGYALLTARNAAAAKTGPVGATRKPLAGAVAASGLIL
jgi:RepB DNA-primase from phage plasmid